MGLYLVIFSIQFVACVIIIAWHETTRGGDGRTTIETFIAVGRGVAPFIPGIMVETIIVVEGGRGVMVLAQYLYDKLVVPQRERMRDEAAARKAHVGGQRGSQKGGHGGR